MGIIFDLPKSVISTVIYRQTGILIPASNIDFVTAHNVASAVVALDEGYIDRKKFNKIIMFNVNNLLEMSGNRLFYTPPKNSSNFTKLNITLNYN